MHFKTVSKWELGRRKPKYPYSIQRLLAAEQDALGTEHAARRDALEAEFEARREKKETKVQVIRRVNQ